MPLKPKYQDILIEAGCDEAGRGCLAGPVFAASVIFPNGYTNSEINDSKTLNSNKRQKLRECIEKEALSFHVSRVEPSEIDLINILQSSFLAMHKAIEGLNIVPEMLLIDGNRFRAYKTIPHICIIKGDGLYLSIAAASILAKTYRDDYMEKLHASHPQYNWMQNKGYPTLEHRRAVAKYGTCAHHRQSFTTKPL